MREISHHILDVAMNSVEAGANLLRLYVWEEGPDGFVRIAVMDNGAGMGEERAAQAANPFYTTRSTRRFGLGLPLFRAACQRCDGDLTIRSQPGRGTLVRAWLRMSHIDRAPLGDMGAVLQALACETPRMRLRYRHRTPSGIFSLDSRELQRELEEVPLTSPTVLAWIAKYANIEVENIGSVA